MFLILLYPSEFSGSKRTYNSPFAHMVQEIMEISKWIKYIQKFLLLHKIKSDNRWYPSEVGNRISLLHLSNLFFSCEIEKLIIGKEH